MRNRYKPDHTFHPSEHVKQILKDLQISIHDASQMLRVPLCVMEDLIACRIPVTRPLAEKLGVFNGNLTYFWMNLQRNYDRTLRSISEPTLRIA